VDLLLILIVILIIVLVWRGPQMLPQIGAALGKAVKGVRDNMNDEDERADTAEVRVDPAAAPTEPGQAASGDDDGSGTRT
jgi:TatA/E family protein of Tat protein translocase